MLSIGARVVGEGLADEILRVWLTTAFEGGRHQRRIDEITAIENGGDSDVTTPAEALAATDPEIADIIRREVERQNTTVQLIASENFTSPAVLAAQGSVLTNKYSEGYPAKRYYGGNFVVDEAEVLARDRALRAVRRRARQRAAALRAPTPTWPRSWRCSSPATRSWACASTRAGTSPTGRRSTSAAASTTSSSYGVDRDSERIDHDELRDLALAERPKLIIAGATAYPRIIDFAAFREIADEVGALLMVDAAHIAGLVAGGAHPSPVPYADVVTTTTHKTLRGPRAGAIMCREQYAAAIDKAVFPGLQGGPLMHVVAAKAVAFKEAMQPEFADYAAAIVRNAAALADALAAEGFRIVSGGTDNHLMLVDLRPFGVTGKVGPGGARPRRDHLQQERDPERPREAVRHQRAPARHRRGHDRGHARAGDAGDLLAHRAGAAQGRRRGHRGRRPRPGRRPLRPLHPVPGL